MNEFNSEEFGKRIMTLRESSGKSQEEICSNLGVTQQTLSRYEKGQRQASLDFVVRASRFFNVSADYLLGLSDVSSVNEDIKTACKVTGLSEQAIKQLQYSNLLTTIEIAPNMYEKFKQIDALNYLLEQEYSDLFLSELSATFKTCSPLILTNDINNQDESEKYLSKFTSEEFKEWSYIHGIKMVNKAEYAVLHLQNATYVLESIFRDLILNSKEELFEEDSENANNKQEE